MHRAGTGVDGIRKIECSPVVNGRVLPGAFVDPLNWVTRNKRTLKEAR
jgi:hypothetical protein